MASFPLHALQIAESFGHAVMVSPDFHKESLANVRCD